MALLWIEGFESFGTTNGVAPVGLIDKYPVTNQVAFSYIQDGRIAGKALRQEGGSGYIQTRDLTASTTIIMGFGLQYTVQPSGSPFLRYYETGATLGLEFRVTATGEISAWRNATFLGTSSGAGLSTGVWKYIEIKAILHNSAGAIEVRVAGATVLNLTSIDTQQTATTKWYGFRLVSAGSTIKYEFDDWYIADTTGAQNNDFLGNVRVDMIQANATGDSNDWTPSAGSNYQNVDENPTDGDTTYNEDSTSTNKDLFNYASVPSGLGDIKGIQINTTCRETDATTFTLKTLVKTGTTESADTAQTIGTTSWTTLYRIVELDPDTSSAWISSGINGAQFGYETG